jgi:DNA-binding MarR family transcriptional regulator
MSGMRRRNAVLQAVELLRRLDPSINISQVRAFLYICENEGLSVSELAELLAMTRATGSRVVHSIARDDAPDAPAAQLGLVEVATSDRGEPLKAIRLTSAGRRLKDRIDAIIAQAHPIARPGLQVVVAGTSV